MTVVVRLRRGLYFAICGDGKVMSSPEKKVNRALIRQLAM